MPRRPFSAKGLRLTPPPRHPIVQQWSYADLVRRGEVAYLFCDHCVPPVTVDAILFDEPPWNRFLNHPAGTRFRCPGCRRPMVMHVHYGPGTPSTERFEETD